MSEVFETIPNYTNYSIGSAGSVINNNTGKSIIVNCNPQGDLKVGLYNDGVRRTLGIRALVANAFCDKPTEDSDTVIVLNLDKTDCRAINLAWRPHWFAWQYKYQFTEYDYHELSADWTQVPIEDIQMGRGYSSIYEAAQANGLLMRHISKSADIGFQVFPTNQRFGYTAKPESRRLFW